MSLLAVSQVNNLPNLSGGYLFNSPEFQSLKLGTHINFALTKDGQSVARIWFTIMGQKAISGHRATFGSVDYDSSIDNDEITYFLKEVVKRLTKEDITEIIIKHWPLTYDDSLGERQFEKIGFKISDKNVNQHLIINHKSYWERIKRNEQKKLSQAQDKGYTYRLLSIDDLKDGYHLIEETRIRKGYPVSMDYQELYETFEKFPDKYLLFGLFDNDKLIAASVSIRISDTILYNFYHADAIAYRSTSPLVMLVGKIYEYCQQKGIGILDLGISSDKGTLNEGLFNFKKNLGCETSSKNTYYLINE